MKSNRRNHMEKRQFCMRTVGKVMCTVILAVHFSFLCSCSPVPENIQQSDFLPPIYPDYLDITIPKNIAPLNFLLRADDCEALHVTVGASDINSSYQHTVTLHTRGNEAVFNQKEWSALLEESAGDTLYVHITALVDGRWTEYKPFKWHVTKDQIDPYLTYRLIEPDYEIWNHLEIQQRCLENYDTKSLGHHEQLENRCMNCHTFGSQDPTLSMMYVRGPGGGAILNQNGTLHKLNIPGSVYFGFSPSGRYLVFSTNKIIPAFHSIPRKRLEVFDSQSDILVADLQDHRIFSSTLLSDSTKFETFPTFSPDGHYIYFCAADSVNLPQDIQHLHYSLVRIPFDEQTGQIGTTVDTLVKCNTMASQSTGQSVCHPRISPDGRLLLYTVADYGTFPIWHPEADLQMLNLETGTIDSLQAVNSQKSDTYHSWSSNSRWFVFASKRDDGLFGKPYFCYVDKTGRAHKPFCLPQRHPTYYDNTLKSFNAPELGRGSVWFDTDDVAKAMKQAAETFTYQKY